MSAKDKVRKEILAKLRRQRDKERIEKSKLIKEKLFSLKDFKEANNIMCYISLGGEVDTTEIIKGALKLGKRVFTPFIEGERLGISELRDPDKDLEKGPFGILQAKKGDFCAAPSAAELDLVLVPGVAFDKKGNRLGRGKGYFDRFLKELPQAAKTIGLAFDAQILKSIPADSDDIPVSLVITN